MFDSFRVEPLTAQIAKKCFESKNSQIIDWEIINDSNYDLLYKIESQGRKSQIIKFEMAGKRVNI